MHLLSLDPLQSSSWSRRLHWSWLTDNWCPQHSNIIICFWNLPLEEKRLTPRSSRWLDFWPWKSHFISVFVSFKSISLHHCKCHYSIFLTSTYNVCVRYETQGAWLEIFSSRKWNAMKGDVASKNIYWYCHKYAEVSGAALINCLLMLRVKSLLPWWVIITQQGVQRIFFYCTAEVLSITEYWPSSNPKTAILEYCPLRTGLTLYILLCSPRTHFTAQLPSLHRWFK